MQCDFLYGNLFKIVMGFLRPQVLCRILMEVVISYGFLMFIMRIAEFNLTFPLMKEPR